MFGYIIRRLVAGFLVLIAVSLGTFALFTYGPADPAQAMCPETHCTPQRLADIRKNLGLDEPFWTQYGTYMKGIVTGRDIASGAINIPCPAPCLGVSFKLRLDVAHYLLGRFPATLSLAIGASVIYFPLGLLIGVIAARKRGTWIDKGSVGASLVLNAVPYYLLALLAWIYFVSLWGIFPQTGYIPITHGVLRWAGALLLPWLVLGIWNSTAYARFSRGSMVEALSEDFVRTANAKGLSRRRILVKHALRAAVVPVVTIFGLDFAYLLGGTFFTEKIFDIQGIGLTALDALNQADLPIIQATVLIAAAFIVLMNIVVDIMYTFIDPRVRLT